MIITTSISPKHSNFDNQIRAIKSWQQYGLCYSFNTKKEIEELKHKDFIEIKFIETDKTIQSYVGKPLVCINAFVDFAKEKKTDLLIVNSDIILNDLPEFKKDGITIFSRYDYKENFEESDMFIYGFDAFFIPNQFLHLLPPCIYSLGAAWHDFVFPYYAIKNNVPVYYPEKKHAFHKWHETQYSIQEWYLIGKYFRLDFGFPDNMPIENVAQIGMSTIQHKLIKI